MITRGTVQLVSADAATDPTATDVRCVGVKLDESKTAAAPRPAALSPCPGCRRVHLMICSESHPRKVHSWPPGAAELAFDKASIGAWLELCLGRIEMHHVVEVGVSRPLVEPAMAALAVTDMTGVHLRHIPSRQQFSCPDRAGRVRCPTSSGSAARD